MEQVSYLLSNNPGFWNLKYRDVTVLPAKKISARERISIAI
jgi:hypothetical protein